MPQTHPHHARLRQPLGKRAKQKKPADLTDKLAKDPRRFTIEVGSAEVSGFELRVYGSAESGYSAGMSCLCHQKGFKSFKSAAAALYKKLTQSTKVPGTNFTTSHLRTVQEKLKNESRSISLPLREVVKAT